MKLSIETSPDITDCLLQLESIHLHLNFIENKKINPFQCNLISEI
jgi:hypothetical protein